MKLKNHVREINAHIQKKARLLLYPPSQKLLFEHIPKCGGSSVTHFLKSQYPDKTIFALDGDHPSKSIREFKALPEDVRFSYDLIVGHGAHQLLHDTHPEKVTATVFREPIDRIISHYFFVRRTRSHYLHEKVMSQNISLEDYVTSGLSGELRNDYVTRFLQIPAEDAERDSEASVERAYRLIRESYTVVGILDNLTTAMDSISQAANFPTRFKDDMVNATVGRPQFKEIAPSTLKTIAEVNFLDIKLYELIKQDVLAANVGR